MDITRCHFTRDLIHSHFPLIEVASQSREDERADQALHLLLVLI